MTLRTRLVGSTVLLVVVLSLAVIGLLRAVLAERLESELQRRGVAIAKYIAADSVDALVTEDIVGLQLILLAGKEIEDDIAYIFVQDPEGAVMAHTFGVAFPTGLRGVNRGRADGGIGVRLLETEEGGIYDLALPLVRGQLGTVRVGMRREPVRAAVAQVIRIGGAATVACLMVFGGVALAIDVGIARELATLGEAARALGIGDLDHRVPVRGRGEFADLARGFNAMADNLRRSEEKLVDLNTTLLREVRDRTSAEGELRRSLERYGLLFDAVSDGIFVCERGPDGLPGRITEVNEAGARQLARTREELLGREMAEIGGVPPEESAASRLRAGETVVFEGSLRVRDGRRLPVEVSARAFELEGRTLVLSICRDVTERRIAADELRRASEELARQNEELKKLDRLREGFIRDVSHELKTPVAKHVMQLEILRRLAARGGFSGEVERVVAVMEGSVRRQQKVIKNLLGLARLEGGARGYRSEEVALDELLRGVVADYEPELAARGIVVRADLAPVAVRSDSEMLWHVFSNLLNNAIKFQKRPEGGGIDVSLRLVGGKAVASVRDEGIGLEPEELERVFEKFYQGSASSEGSGVGLTICRMIVEGVGGSIRFESPGRGGGATAIVELPAGAGPEVS